jgi:hypothetical protein
MAHEFLKAWARFIEPAAGPKILTGDEILLEAKAGLTICHQSWNHFLRDRYFNSSNRRLLNLSLIPQPFFGNIDLAPVVILTLNPGLNAVDYYGERFVSQYRRALRSNLRLGLKKSPFPNLFLNPAFSWHSGFSYWHGRLAGLIDKFADEIQQSRRKVLSFFSQSVAILELVPYHSSSFGLSDSVVRELHSVRLAKDFAQKVLLPDAQASRKLLVVVRKPREWDLPKGPGVILYGGSETRAAHLTPASPGGKAIFEHLLGVWKTRSANPAATFPRTP